MENALQLEAARRCASRYRFRFNYEAQQHNLGPPTYVCLVA